MSSPARYPSAPEPQGPGRTPAQSAALEAAKQLLALNGLRLEDLLTLNAEPVMMRIKDAAAKYSVTPRCIENWVNQGHLKCWRPSNKISYIDERQLRALLMGKGVPA